MSKQLDNVGEQMSLVITIDLTLVRGTVKGIESIHGGGEYGIFSAKHIAENCDAEIVIFCYQKDLCLLKEYIDERRVTYTVISDDDYFCLPSKYDSNNNICFVPLPYLWLERCDIPKKACVWVVMHGMRQVELNRQMAQGLPVKEPGSSGLLCVVRSTIRFFRNSYNKRELERKEASKFLAPLGHLKRNDKVLIPSYHTKWSIEFYRESEKLLNYYIAPPLVPYMNNFTESLEEESGIKVISREFRNGIVLLNGDRLEKNAIRIISAIKNSARIMKLIDGEVIYVTGNLDKMESMPSKLILNGNIVEIKKIGYVGNDELSSLIKQALFLVYPSLSEGYGMPPVIAMGLGTPVLASPFSSIYEVAQDAALYANPYDVSEIGIRMLQLIEDEELWRSLSDKGLTRHSILRDDCFERWGCLLSELGEDV